MRRYTLLMVGLSPFSEFGTKLVVRFTGAFFFFRGLPRPFGGLYISVLSFGGHHAARKSCSCGDISYVVDIVDYIYTGRWIP